MRLTQIIDLNYSIRRHYVDSFLSKHIVAHPSGTNTLDVGGTAQKKGDFNIGQFGHNVITLNIEPLALPDVIANAEEMPFQSEYFDLAICSEVLEHVSDPTSVLLQTHTVLRKGGHILICVPFLARIHNDPNDFGRYTDQFWRRILADIGFIDVTIEFQGDFYSVIIDFLKKYTRSVKRPILPRPVMYMLVTIMQYVFFFGRQNTKKSDMFVQSFTTGFGISARKG